MKGFKKAIALFAGVSLLFSYNTALAHGGHHSSSHHTYESEHHYYHCDGHSAHLHPNGVCPYASSAKTSVKGTSKYYKVSTVKKVQCRLNDLGYKCGTPNGICGTKTINAIKKFQKKKDITVNGKINKTLIKKLKIKL